MNVGLDLLRGRRLGVCRDQDMPLISPARQPGPGGSAPRPFGRDNVFMDIDTIPFGADFREHIDLDTSAAPSPRYPQR